MLQRLTRSAYVCLRCQKKLARTGPQSLRIADSASVFPPRRWQSSAAAAYAEDDDEAHQDSVRHQPPPRPEDLGPASGYKYRRWKPKRTAELGVNSLGKPAEVLILPSRDRKIPRVPEEDGDKDNVRAMVQQALDFEKEPLKLQDLQANIEQVQSVIGKQRGQLEVAEWHTLKSHLKKGFNRQQLQRYVGALTKMPATKATDTQFMKWGKPQLIQHIVQEVWGFTMPSAAKLEALHNKHGSSSQRISNEARMDWLLKDSRQPLKRVSEEFNVEIDVFRARQTIRVRGAVAWVAKAWKEINRLVKDLTVLVIQFGGLVGKTYHDPALQDRIQAFLRSVEQKYQVYIILKKDHIEVVHDNRPNHAAHAHREILLAAETLIEPQEVAIWNNHRPCETTMMPYPTPAEFSGGLYQLPWTRQVAVNNDAQPGPETIASSSDSMIDDIERWFNQTLSGTRTLSLREDMHYDFSVRFGHALFRDKKNLYNGAKKVTRAQTTSTGDQDLTTVPPSKHKDSPPGGEAETEPSPQMSSKATKPDLPRFVGDIPYLTQVLAPMKPWSQPGAAESYGDATARATLRLELAPSPNIGKAQRYPSFEILINAGQSAEGKRSTLKIVRLLAVYDDHSFTALCPGHQVDVKFRGRLLRDLLSPDAVETKAVKLILSQFREYVNRAQAQEVAQWLFAPFVKLSMHQSLARDTQGLHPENATQEKGGRPIKDADSPEQAKYVLHTVDVMDTDSRVVSVSSTGHDNKLVQKHELCLEHTTLTGANTTKQELRLAEQPSWYGPGLASPDVRLLAGTAREISRWLGHNPSKTDVTAFHEGIRLPQEISRLAQEPVVSPAKTKGESSRKALSGAMSKSEVDKGIFTEKGQQLDPEVAQKSAQDAGKQQQGETKAAEKPGKSKPLKKSPKSRAWKKKN